MEKAARSSRLIRVVAAGALAASLGLGAVSSAHADPTNNLTGGTCTFLASPGYYLNNGKNGAGDGFPRITPS